MLFEFANYENIEDDQWQVTTHIINYFTVMLKKYKKEEIWVTINKKTSNKLAQ